MVDLANAQFEDTRFYHDLKAMEQNAVEKATKKATAIGKKWLLKTLRKWA